ncbi:MAG: hypothetical protein M3313_02185 [Actinomycetota bacterium]|nr:hypothetical protein [Actinomycetota bacterium]
MAATRAELTAVRKVSEAPFANAVRTSVQKGHKGAVLSEAMNLAPRSRAGRLTELFALITGDGNATWLRLVRTIVERLRRELPEVLAKLPLRPAHFGFRNVDEFVQFIGEALIKMKTRARTRAEFVAGLDGWRWNLVGRVLFERLVKHHPQLQRFFSAWAKDWGYAINAKSRALVNLAGNRISAVGKFGPPRRVEYFVIEGADEVKRAAPDFGFMALDGQGRTALLPIEIKLPGALAGVAGQFSEFVPRLRKCNALYAVVDDGSGKLREVEIKTSSIVFLQDDRAQLAVAPLSKRKAAELLGGGRNVRPDQIASIADLDQGTSSRHGLAYYRARLLIDRSWLEAIVGTITDPPRRAR